MSLTHLFTQFSDHLLITRAASTRHNYTCRVKTFLSGLRSDAAGEFTLRNGAAYMASIAHRRPRTRNSHKAALNAFGNYLVDVEYLAVNPMTKLKSVPLDPPRRLEPTDAQAMSFHAACARLSPAYRRHLATAVVAILVYAGLRRGELLALDLADIDLAERVIYVRHGKGDKAREVLMSSSCLRDVSAYMAMRPDCKKKRLFLLRHGMQMADEGLRILLKDVMVAGDIDPELPSSDAYLPHGFRHNFATRLRQNGATIEEVGEVLGHADPSTTMLYLDNPRQRMRRVAEMAEISAPPPAPDPPAQSSPTVLRMWKAEEEQA
jgi:site-specific recombinase XerD